MLKRLFDVTFSLTILIITAPLALIIACLIKLASGGPVIFIQKRLGKKARSFKIYKFRTMISQPSDDSSSLLTLADDQRITKIGRTLRNFKLDELPQFINVLKGEMSVVGPRPDLPEYYDLNNPLHQKVLSAKPGITCLAGIEYSLSKKQEAEILAQTKTPERAYRDKIFPAKMALNLKYVQEQSFWFDLKIISQTIYYLLRKIVNSS